jgi:hypothetical protein
VGSHEPNLGEYYRKREHHHPNPQKLRKSYG